MAEQTEIKKVISVDLGNTTTSLKEYKKHIDELRGSLLQLDETSEEYAKIADEIKSEQDKLNQVMAVGKKNTDAADGSYDKLVQTMAELKKQWRATADETERADLGKQINGINDKLKTLDASTGNFQRNVGNYEGGFSKAMQGLAGGIKGAAIPAVSGLGRAFTALAANPIGAVIAALALGIKALTNAMKGNEETSNRMKIALSALEPIINLIKKAFDLLAQKVTETFEEIGKAIQDTLEGISSALHWLGWDEWAGAIDKYLEKAQQAVNLSEREVNLSIQKRENTKKEAEIELQISDLRAKMADKENYNAQQRLEFLNQWEAKEKELADIKLKQAKEEYDLIVERNSLTANSAEDNQAEADAYVNLMNAQREYNEGLRSVTRQKQALINEIKGINKGIQNGIQLTANYNLEIQKLADTIEERLRKANMTELELLEEKYNEEKDILEQAGRDTTELTSQFEKEKLEIITKSEDEQMQVQQKAVSEAISNQITELERAKDIELEIFNTTTSAEIENASEKASRIMEIEQTFLAEKISLLESELELWTGTEDEKKQKEAELDGLRHKYTLNAIEYSHLLRKAEEEDAEATKKKRIQAIQGALGVASDMFGSIADLAEENSKEQKAFAIMQATMDTFSAAIAAYKSASEIPYAGWILGPIAAAAATVAGIANIQKIKSTNKGSSNASASTPSSVSASSMTAAAVSPLLNEQEDINRMTTLSEQNKSNNETQNLRVYVVDQDIRDANNKAEVVESNATF